MARKFPAETLDPVFDFSGKVALVTGSARGIGRNIAEKLAGSGSVVLITDIDDALGKKTQKDFQEKGYKVEFFNSDLSEPKNIARLFDKIDNLGLRVDYLINNVRGGARTDLLSETIENWNLTISTILGSAFFCAQEFVRRSKNLDNGVIVNIGSIAGSLVCPHSPSYHVAKSSLSGLTHYLAVQSGQNVRANAIIPGFIVRDEDQSRFKQADNLEYRELSNAIHPVGRVGTADDIANLVAFLCSDYATFMSGECIVIDGALSVQEQSTLLFKNTLFKSDSE